MKIWRVEFCQATSSTVLTLIGKIIELIMNFTSIPQIFLFSKLPKTKKGSAAISRNHLLMNRNEWELHPDSSLKNVPYRKTQVFQWVGKTMRLKFNLGFLVLSSGQLKIYWLHWLQKKKSVDWPKLQYKNYFSAHCKVSPVMKQGMKGAFI